MCPSAPARSKGARSPSRRQSPLSTMDFSTRSRRSRSGSKSDATTEASSTASGDSARPPSPPNVPQTITTEGAGGDRRHPHSRGDGVAPARLALALGLGALLAFGAGTAARIAAGRAARDGPAAGPPAAASLSDLPIPAIIPGKEVPDTTFATRTFAHTGAATSHTVHLDRNAAPPTGEDEEDEEDEDEDDNGSDDGDAAEEDLHLPAGQHLLVDIQHVDPGFLASEARLAEAMLGLVNESKLTLLSYHCHGLVPEGVSCAGVLLESHVAFHTWPSKGVVVMDLFTCGSGALIPILPLIARLFGVPQRVDLPGLGPVPAPDMRWSHKLRGFREGFAAGYKRYENPLEQDLSTEILAPHDGRRKAPLASVATAFQHVDVYEVEVLRGPAALRDASYEAAHPELFAPERVLHLDGVLQSTLRGDAAYHEALVHPALLAHPDPGRVAIVGGGEGATLREVLKHRTVKEAVMVEIDEELVALCREHLPEWSDCSDVAGSDADSCFDNSRATLRYTDAFEWFLDSFGDDADVREEERFDVIVMDALDPDQFVEIVGNLYKDDLFVGSLFRALSEEGVFVIQMGESFSNNDPAMDAGPNQDAQNMMNALKNVGFESIHMYDEGHSHFLAPWSYFVCFKDAAARARWHANPAEVEVALHRRLHGTRSGAPPLRFFDGATMASYQVPPKAAETAYCRMADTPWECRDLAAGRVDAPSSHLAARKSALGDHAGRGLFAARDIPAGSSLDLAGSAKSFFFWPSTWSTIEDLYENSARHVQEALSSMYTFAPGYGFAATLLGETHLTVDSGLLIFCNHGCNGTSSYGCAETKQLGYTEINVALEEVPEDLLQTADIVYSPLNERHLRQRLSSGDKTLRDIKQGEEILCDYLSFVGNPEDWVEDVVGLREQCSGEAVGDIQEYELQNGMH